MDVGVGYPGRGPLATSRAFQSGDDLRQMLGLLMTARAGTDDWRYWHVGDLAFWYFMVDCHLSPREFIRLWHAPGGELIGYALLGEDPSLDWQVLPEFEGQGIELAAIAWAKARLVALRSGDARTWGGDLIAGARQDASDRITLMEANGFQRRRYVEVNMLRSLGEPIPATETPAGFQVRALSASGENAERAAAHREVWQPWTVGNVSADDYARLMRLPVYDRELDVVAVSPDGVIAAYVNGWIDPVNRIGDFGPVGARPDYRRRGLTRAVLLECLRRMRDRGMDRVSVSTGETNLAAIRLYESIGFRVVNRYLEFGMALRA